MLTTQTQPALPLRLRENNNTTASGKSRHSDLSEKARPTMIRFFHRMAVSGRPVGASENGVAPAALALPARAFARVGADTRPDRISARRFATCSDRAADAS